MKRGFMGRDGVSETATVENPFVFLLCLLFVIGKGESLWEEKPKCIFIEHV